MSSNSKVNEAFADVKASGGIIFNGPYAELCRFLEQVERDKPDSIKLIYTRYSPGRLYLKAEDER